MSLSLSAVSVMVAEDCDYVRRMLADMLHSFGVTRIHEVANGREAIGCFRYTTPDLLIADWKMAPVNGIALTTFVRRDRASPNPAMPVILATMNTSPEIVFGARDAGVHEVLAKPFAPKTLRERLCQVLSHPRPFVQVPDYVGPDRRRWASEVVRAVERRSEHQPIHMTVPAITDIRDIQE